MKTNLEKAAYEASSQMFSFKDMRRGIVEHGRVCYIEGYKRCFEQLSNFMIRNGYLSGEECKQLFDEFHSYEKSTTAVSLESLGNLLSKSNILDYSNGIPVKASELTAIQSNIAFYYVNSLCGNFNVLRIKKARQMGISTILSMIAKLEADGGKRVLYIGFDKPWDKLGIKNLHGIDFKTAHRFDINKAETILNRYDLIIVDEMFDFDSPISIYQTLRSKLSENGKMIVTSTPPMKHSYCYKSAKEFLEWDDTHMLTYKTGENKNAVKKLEIYPECKNEAYGEFID